MRRALYSAGVAAAFSAAGTASAFSQDDSPAQFEAVRGIETETTGPDGAVGDGSPVVGRISLTQADLRRLAGIERTTQRLDRSALAAFHRGLMPLPDLLDQTDLADRTDLWIHQIRRDGGEQAVLVRQVRRLRDVVSHLESFNQPNSSGWRADLALARWALSDAEFRAAAAGGDEVAAARSGGRRAEFAREVFEFRTADAAIGLASPEAVLRAAAIVVASPSADSNANMRAQRQYFNLADMNVEQTERWGLLGAGVGRVDRIEQARVHRDFALLRASLDNGEASISARLLARTEAQVQSAFADELRFFATGAASLYDVAETWRTWSDMHLSVAEVAELADLASTGEREEALDRLRLAADSISDLRGRHEADVLFVDVLETVDELSAMRQQVTRSENYLQ
ncbi:MAG: hypothetical protein DWQ34_05140 [Planctomycetota bacterium]|nr:MAG: hypothetical protein DWQ34_05140 [Planctomycetota bacterium]